MIKDAVYASLLKRARATLHERFVTWAERVNRERGREQEFEEIHGYHLEQAYRYRTELGPLDAEVARSPSARNEALERRPARLVPWRHAGSVSLLKRAAAVLPTESPARLGILFDLGEAMIGHGSFDDARALITEGTAIAERWATSGSSPDGINELMLDQFTGTGSSTQQIERAKAIIKVLERYDDDFALARAWNEVTFRELTAGDTRRRPSPRT